MLMGYDGTGVQFLQQVFHDWAGRDETGRGDYDGPRINYRVAATLSRAGRGASAKIAKIINVTKTKGSDQHHTELMQC